MASDAARRRQLAAIHAARRDLGLDESEYRDLLERLTGLRSAGDLDAAGRLLVLDTMRGGKGGKARRRSTVAADQARLAAHRAAGARPQEALILSLWDELAEAGAFRTGDTARLDTFMARTCGRPVSHPRFLRPAEGGKVIEGLRAWLARARAA